MQDVPIKILPYSLKFSVLRPKAKIYDIKNALQNCSTETQYKVSRLPNQSFRRYQTSTAHSGPYLQVSEWRHETNAPLVHLLYVEILPQLKSAPTGNAFKNRMHFYLYLEHLQTVFDEFPLLHLHQIIYVLRECLLGFEILLNKFKKVAVHPRAIGVNVIGKVKVWLTPQLESYETEGHSSKGCLVREIVQLISKKADGLSQSFLNRMARDLFSRVINPLEDTFEQVHTYLQQFVSFENIQVATSLRRLAKKEVQWDLIDLHKGKSKDERSQQNLKIFNRNISSSKDIVKEKITSNTKKGFSFKSGKMITIQNKIQKLSHTDGYLKSSVDIEKCGSNNSQAGDKRNRENSIKVVRKVEENQRKLPFNETEGSTKDSSWINLTDQVRSPRKSQPINAQMLKSFKKIEPEKTQQEKNDERSLKKDNMNRSIFTKCCSDNESKEALINHSGFSNDFASKSRNTGDFLENTQRKKTHQSHVHNQVPKIIQKLEMNEDCESYESRSDDSIPNLNHRHDDVIKANGWTDNISNLLRGKSNSKMKVSVMQGADVYLNHYLSDITLQKLDRLSPHMTVSVIPDIQNK